MRLLALIRAMLSLRLLSALAALLIPAAAIAEPGDVQTAWRLLDYMAVDYGGASPTVGSRARRNMPR
ncbi:hypothetical protein NVSP9465_03937 [Novosphingobium sp. CECT 9465]|nr:hypothetical protein NVSP9465_03937 [Novosphingobium sp. CECT 9465]